MLDSAPKTEELKFNTAKVVKCSALNVRRSPNPSSLIVTVVPRAEQITVVNIKSTCEWVKIITADGLEGYVMADFIKVTE